MRDDTWFLLRVEILYNQLFMYKMKHSSKIIVQLLAYCPLLWRCGKSPLQRSSLRLSYLLVCTNHPYKNPNERKKKHNLIVKHICYKIFTVFWELFSRNTIMCDLWSREMWHKVQIYLYTQTNTCAHMHTHTQVCTCAHTEGLFYSQK